MISARDIRSRARELGVTLNDLIGRAVLGAKETSGINFIEEI